MDLFSFLYSVDFNVFFKLLLSRVQLFVTPWTVAHQAPLSMGFPRQEHWSGLPFPSLAADAIVCVKYYFGSDFV